MVTIYQQIETPYKAVERQTKLAWHLRFLYSILEFARNSYKKNLDTLYITLLGAIELTNEFSHEEAKKELINITRMQTALMKLEHYLEKSNFLMDADIRNKWNKCMDALYHLEGEVRIKAFANQQKQQDKEFIYSISSKSNDNMASIIAKYAV